jgi:hypothetical protein
MTTRKLNGPTWKTSPSRSVPSVTLSPLMRTPARLPQSRTEKPPEVCVITQCSVEMSGASRTMSQLRARPMMVASRCSGLALFGAEENISINAGCGASFLFAMVRIRSLKGCA